MNSQTSQLAVSRSCPYVPYSIESALHVNGQAEIPPTAAERKGIQPVGTLMANGGVRADVVTEKECKSRVDFDSPSFDVYIEQDNLQPNCNPILPNRQILHNQSQEKGVNKMKVVLLGKATAETEAGVMPTLEALAEMDAFNEALANAGVVILGGAGLHPSARGVRVYFDGTTRTVVDGPFTEAKELVAGFAIWEVKSMAEALDLVQRSPFPNGSVELRPIMEPEDFGEEFSPERQP